MPRQQQPRTEKNQLALGGHFNAQLISRFFCFQRHRGTCFNLPLMSNPYHRWWNSKVNIQIFHHAARYKLVHFPGLLVDVSISKVAADLSMNFRKGFMLIGVSSINSPLTRANCLGRVKICPPPPASDGFKRGAAVAPASSRGSRFFISPGKRLGLTCWEEKARW